MRTDVPLLVCLAMTACGAPDATPKKPVAAAAVATSAAAGPRLLTPADPAASILSISKLQGRWRVTGVALADGRVQAYAADDPAYMGQVMTISGTSLGWSPSPQPTTANLGDNCIGAATMRLPAAASAGMAGALARFGARTDAGHEIACLDGGGWGGDGGGARLFPIDARTLAMRWYDNVVLKLEWQGRD